MERKFRITIEGRAYTVLVEDITEDGGRLYPSPAPNMGAAPAPAAPPISGASGGGAGGPAAPAAGLVGPVTTSPDDRLSPLAGVVVAVEVTAGQTVQAGDRIAVIEAMKMKTTVTAHKAGTVSEVKVKAGDSVEAGQVLIVIR